MEDKIPFEEIFKQIESVKPVMKSVNLKLKKGLRAEFKRKARKRGFTMQSVFELFVEMYVNNPDMFKVKMEMNSLMFPKESQMVKQNISYRTADYKNFELQRACIDDKLLDEYHLKVKNNVRVDKFANYMQQKFQGCEVSILDPDNLLNLEHHIFVIVKDPLISESMKEAFEKLDETVIEAISA